MSFHLRFRVGLFCRSLLPFLIDNPTEYFLVGFKLIKGNNGLSGVCSASQAWPPELELFEAHTKSHLSFTFLAFKLLPVLSQPASSTRQVNNGPLANAVTEHFLSLRRKRKTCRFPFRSARDSVCCHLEGGAFAERTTLEEFRSFSPSFALEGFLNFYFLRLPCFHCRFWLPLFVGITLILSFIFTRLR